jgi:hypothetical protein
MPRLAATIAGLKTLRRCLPEAAETLCAKMGPSFDHWIRTLDRKILPRMDPDFPLVAAICGGGSAGKSTLFNTLAGQGISPTGGRAGLNRRVLVAVSDAGGRAAAVIDQLPDAFDTLPAALDDPGQLLRPGGPLYHISGTIPPNLVLLDTPDIDTGSGGAYANRDLARQSLEVADLFIYIFTNATYNNLDNTDFIARMLTGAGTRPSVLVYRAYPGFSDDEVREHAGTVAVNIYRPGGESNVLAIYRAEENNRVAAGEIAMQLRSVSGQNSSLADYLARLDTGVLRSRLLDSMIADAGKHGLEMAAALAERLADVKRYASALEQVQHQCVQQALSHFPTDRVLRRFARIWLDSDPMHIKLMRRTGRVVQWPMRTAMKAIRHFRGNEETRQPDPTSSELDSRVELDLITAANRLYSLSIAESLPLQDRSVNVPPAVLDVRRALSRSSWEASLQAILEQKSALLSWSEQLDGDLESLAGELRSRMGFVDQVRQTFAAMLNVIPATAAVTYILHTGDPVGAAGIKVKLTGLFGLNDLYALIAIPATAGMSRADRSQLEQLLAPLAQTWLAHKSLAVRTLFERQVTGTIFSRLNDVIERTSPLLEAIGRTSPQ